MGVIAKGIPRGYQGLFTPVSLGYPLSVFNKNSTLKENLRSSVPPPIVKRSELGGSWRRLSEKKISCKPRVCHVRVTVDLPTFCLVTIFSVEGKELELELEQLKKIVVIPVFIKELGNSEKERERELPRRAAESYFEEGRKTEKEIWRDRERGKVRSKQKNTQERGKDTGV